LVNKRFSMEVNDRLQSLKATSRTFGVFEKEASPATPAQPYGLMASEDDVEPKVRVEALRRVKGFLGGTWKEIDETKIMIKKISGGLSNYLYMCQLPPDVTIKAGETKHAMLRFYGEILRENSDSLVIDTVIFALLAEKGFGPKLYGVFQGGRLEQYINHSRCLRCHELSIPNISIKIAQKIALFHTLQMPLNKEPRFLIDLTERLLDASEGIIWPSGRDSPPNPALAVVAEKWDLQKEWKRLSEIIEKVPSEVVFCHNDLQEGNLLLMERLAGAPRRISSTSPIEALDNFPDPPNDESVHLPVIQPIDFEYCAYNNRGYDFGNHFLEWCYDYHVYEFPWYKANLNDYPTKPQQMLFIRTYLQSRHKNLLKLQRQHIRESGLNEPKLESGIGMPNFDLDSEADKLYREANVYGLLSHFMWALWSFKQDTISKITFAYNEYGILRLEHYYDQLARINAEGLLPADLTDPVT